MPERATKDVEVLVHAADRPRFEAAQERAGWSSVRSLVFVNQPRREGSAWQDAAAARRLDLLSIDAPWVDAAIEGAEPRDVEGLGGLALPYLVLAKLESLRTQDVADLSRMPGIASRRGDEALVAEVRTVVERSQPDRLDEVDRLIELGKWEIGVEEERRPPHQEP